MGVETMSDSKFLGGGGGGESAASLVTGGEPLFECSFRTLQRSQRDGLVSVELEQMRTSK